jgi:hypothetical protein
MRPQIVRRMSLLVARNGHAAAVATCLLSGDERTYLKHGPMSENDPQRSSAGIHAAIARAIFSPYQTDV